MTDYRYENIRLLRSRLRMTQKEFLTTYYADEKGVPRISIATLSNLEARGGASLAPLTEAVSRQMYLPEELFSLPPAEFSAQLDAHGIGHFTSGAGVDGKPGKVAEMVNLLTAYFADEIFAGRLKRGDKIDSDRDLAARFKVGRSVLREAMKVLNVMGMVDIRPGQGTFISSTDTEYFVIPLMWSYFLSEDQLEQILMLREVLEEQSAELAAKCPEVEKKEKLQTLFAQMGKDIAEENLKDFLEHDVDFHLAIAACSGNRVICSNIQTIRNLMRFISLSGITRLSQMQAIHEEHRQILQSVLDGNADAAREAMRGHLNELKHRYELKEIHHSEGGSGGVSA